MTTTAATTFEIGRRLSDRSIAAARKRGIDPARFVRDLAREQLLAAVGRVADEGVVALKGSALVLLDPDMGEWVRPSKDLDLHLDSVNADDLRHLMHAAATNLAEIGIAVEYGARRQLWRPDGTPGGEKIKVVALFGKTRASFEVDAWLGGKRSPGMRLLERPSTLPGMPPVRMLAYPPEAMLADKLHAIAQFGGENTRMKDFYDILHLARRSLDADLLRECVAVTFGNNGRAVPLTPVMLPSLARSFGAAKQDAWVKMLSEAGRTDMAPANFVEVVDRVRALGNWAFLPPQPRDESHITRDSVADLAPRVPAYA